MQNEANETVGMFYAYQNGKHIGSANILGRERLQEERPDLEWLSQEEHDQRECLQDKQEMRAYDILQEMKRGMDEFNEYTEELCNG